MTDTPTSNSGYAGDFQVPDSASEFAKYTFLVQSILAKCRTMIPVKVIAVTNSGGIEPVGTVDVLPLVNQMSGNGVSTPHATIFGIPYFRIQGGTNAIIMDPAVDDIGFMVVADRDISAVKSAKAAANPGSRRRFDFADGVYIGGILNGTPEQYVRINSDGIKMVDANGNVLEMKSAGIELTGDVTVIGNLTVTKGLAVTENGDVTGSLRATGDVTAHYGTGTSVGLRSHTHTQANDSGADVEQPTAAPTAGT